MKPLSLFLFVLALFASGCASSNETRPDTRSAEALSGTWTGHWGPSPERQTDVTLELKWDGSTLKGTVNPGRRAMELTKTSFDARTNAITMELDPTDANGDADHYEIHGKVDDKNQTMTGTWTRKNGGGDFTITRE